MTDSANLPGWVRGLVRRFRSALDSLVGAVPLRAASLSVRPREDGPLEVLATYVCTDGITVSEHPLVLGEPAVRWLEANRRELVLEVRPTHADSEFYRPFIRAGVKRVLVVPVMQQDVLAGVLIVASDQSDAYTARHLKVVRLLAGELAPFFPRPAPVRPSTVPLAPAPEPTG
ncbi:MAG TPA: GAF domain-containing protein, partial [Planctomycetota bacterium]|nr:GAF domain-containing protein [Planctomycetota bacterium]